MANVETQSHMSRKQLGERLLLATLKILKENGGEMRAKQMFEAIEKSEEMSEWEKQRYPGGNTRWKLALGFHTAGLVKAGFLIKKKGIWFLTPEGLDALKLGKAELFNLLARKWDEFYQAKKAKQPELTELETDLDGEPSVEVEISSDQIEQQANDQIEKFINKKTPYEFQDLAAALLRGMGYFTPFIAPLGKDGGVDIVAYRDPLGTSSPRIKVQVKHRESPAKVEEVRQLMGLLQKDGDVGIFISSGGFTPDAKTEARKSHVHVEIVDLLRFIQLWQQFYDKLTDEDKARLPLMPIYLLAATS